MREKINKLANGILTSTPLISVEPKEIFLELAPGKTQKCEIEIQSLNNEFVKGLAYSSDTRVAILNSSFGGTDPKVCFEVSLKATDDEEEYDFFVALITNGGEYKIPIRIHRQSVSSDNVLLNLSTVNDFAKIAAEDPESALKIFEYSNFCKAPFMNDLRNRALYFNFIQNSDHRIALEQFLVSCGITDSPIEGNDTVINENTESTDTAVKIDENDNFEFDRILYFKKHYYEFSKLRLYLEINKLHDNELNESIEEELSKLNVFSSFGITAALYKAENEFNKGNRVSAEKLLSAVSEAVLSNRQDNIQNYFLFEFLDILINNNESKKNSFIRLCHKFIEEEHQLNLFYYIVRLDDELNSNIDALHTFLSEMYNLGCRSPYLYYFNTVIINNNPEFLYAPKSIDNQTINFARKYNILSANIGTAVLSASCSAYIKADRRSVSVHKTYSDAIDSGLNIIGLYDYYLYSLPKDINYVISDKVIEHYKNDDSLELTSKIRLYTNIVKYKNHNSSIYRMYESRIYKLAYQQLKEGNIDIYLSELYKGAIKTDTLDKETADKMFTVLNTYLVQTENKYLKNVLVVYPQFREPQVFSLKNGQTNVTVYDPNAELLFQDVFGNRFYKEKYRKTLLLDSYTLKNAVEKLSQNNPYIKTKKAAELINKKSLSTDDVALLESILFELPLSEGFKALIINRLIHYYNQHTANGYNPQFLLKINKKNLDSEERQALCNAYISCNCFDEAYEMISQFGTSGILPKNIKYLCSSLIALDIHTDDKLLLNLSVESFCRNLTDNVILDFLARRFNGLSETMFQINEKCIEYNLETYDLEERLLAQFIFINDFNRIDYVFNWYVSRKRVSESLVKAYFTVKTADYFLNNNTIDTKVFSYLEDTINESGDMDSIPVLYRLSLLKLYSADRNLSEFRIRISKSFIYSLTEKNIVFPFFMNFNKYYELPDSIRNSTIISYRTENGVIPQLYSCVIPGDKEFTTDAFTSVYLNIYIKIKLLFSDETWEYQIRDNENNLIYEGTEYKSADNEDTDRYSLIDRLCKDYKNNNENSAIRQIREYLSKDIVAKKLFVID